MSSMTTTASRRPVGSSATRGPRPRSNPVHAADPAGSPDLARRPWTIRAGSTTLLVRGARTADLVAVAALHRRCSPTTLLYRFRSGGNPPSITALQHMLSRTFTVVVCNSDGRIVGWGAADAELSRPRLGRVPLVPGTRAEIGILVEDGWQGLGIGRSLVRHLAAAVTLAGVRELVTPSQTAAGVSARLLGEIATTKRIEVDGEPMLRILLPESAALGLGALQRLGSGNLPAASRARTG